MYRPLQRLKNVNFKWSPSLFKKELEPDYEFLRQEFSKNVNLPTSTEKKTNFIGQGFINNHPNYFLTQNLIKNPKWHSAYAAYQSEISQGRLTLFNEFQNLVKMLTNKSVTNSSMLDESTALIDAANMLVSKEKMKNVSIIADENLYFYRKMVLKTYCQSVGWKINFLDLNKNKAVSADILISQTHNCFGDVTLFDDGWKEKVGGHIHILDPKYSLLFEPPRADILVGNMQSFGLPLMGGGPHVGFIAANKEFLRYMPGKMVVNGEDEEGNKLLRLGLQTREQHIKREKALSNICTNQSLMASYVTCWTALNGFEKLLRDMEKIDTICSWFNPNSMDTLTIENVSVDKLNQFKEAGFELFNHGGRKLSATIDWTHTDKEINQLIKILDSKWSSYIEVPKIEQIYLVKEKYNENDFFNKWIKDELGFARYLNYLSKKDFSLIDGPIPLGSCTMKYNPPIIFEPLDNKFLTSLHPFSYDIKKLLPVLINFENILKTFLGMDSVSFQPLAGSHGELTSLLMIRKYFKNRNEDRNIILLPLSCHGTNSASCTMLGYEIVGINDLNKEKTFYEALEDTLSKIDVNKVAGFMVTFPNTFGFFDETILKSLERIKEIGGICYMDGANMNSWIGKIAPGKMGFDIAHINLHKTLAVPHGGGGPGAGPVLCKGFLSPFLPECDINFDCKSIGRVSSSTYGNTFAVLFSYLYTRSLGLEGIIKNTEKALYNANYLKYRLSSNFKIPYSDKDGIVSHELLVDTSYFFKRGITETDICKRLMDYGIHPPTVSWPISRCFLIEPTESETLETLDYLVETLEMIKKEAEEEPELIKNAPYNLRKALESGKNIGKYLFPHPNQNEENKFWVSCSRINETTSDRNASK